MRSEWVDPRYADLVRTWDRVVQRRASRGPVVKQCKACTHGLGTVVMVDLVTKKPFTAPCIRCSPG